jgi:segregation and condensation protein A
LSATEQPWTIDLDVFEGPFDLLVTLILNEDVDLLEVHLAEIVLSYVDRLEARGELDLEAATEFLILIAALLELKSRLMLPSEDDEGLDLDPQEAAEELLARLLDYRRFRAASEWMHERLAAEQAYRYRTAPLPPELRRVTLEAAGKVYEPARLADSMAALLRVPPPVDTSHMTRITVSLERRLAHLRDLLRSRRSFSFDDAVGESDRMTQAVTLFALLELYKSGELVWRQRENFGPIEIMAP